jgi:hypothetical protein
MKSLIYTALTIMLGAHAITAQETPVWEENFDFGVLSDQADGGSIAIDIKNTGEDVQECILKAKSQALYTIIFKGYAKTNSAAGSSALSDMSNYNQNLDFFKNYLSSNTAGLAFVSKASTNTSKPGARLSKKEIETTTTVYILKTKLREDLEKQGYIESAKNIAESLGITPSIMIVPGNMWMNKAGFMKTVESDMGTQQIFDYSAALVSEKMVIFKSLEGFLRNPLQKNGFKIDDLSATLNQIASDKAANNMRNTTVQEDPMDLLARTASSDIWLNVDVITESVSGGMEKQYQITLSGVDPLLGRSVINGNPQTVKSAGDNDLRMLETAINAAIDNFIPEVISYYKERDEKGLPGKIEFLISEDASFTFDDEIDIDGEEYAWAQIIDAMVGKQAIKYTPSGGQTSSMRKYEVTIPTKVENKLSGKVESNNYESFARKVKSEIKKLGNVKAIVETRGLGKVVVIFTENL